MMAMLRRSPQLLPGQFRTRQFNHDATRGQRQQLSRTPVKHPKPNWVEFAAANHGPFKLNPPELKNPWTHDQFANKLLEQFVPKEVLRPVTSDLARFGDRIVTEIDELGNECERNPPQLTNYDAWGKSVSKLDTCSAWKTQKNISAEEGLVAIPYENPYGKFSRLYQTLKLFLYAPSSGLYSCPLAMTDGAAKCIKSLGLGRNDPYSVAFKRLTSRDPKKFWTSGQWMTERGGGSDVASGTETLAVLERDDIYRLYGYKWFSSATDSDMALTLARITDAEGNYINGTSGLTMFFLKTRDEDNQLNNINVVKLKNKLGTRQLPTAELLLDGSYAYKMSSEGRGVASIADMLQITRLHNSMSSVAAMRRLIMLATDYANKRVVFGKHLSQHTIHTRTLAKLEVESRAAMVLLCELACLLGAVENNEATTEDKQVLRLINPVVKLYTAKQAIAVASECLEAFGGQGYIEDTNLPRALRDAQVLSIWEGTTNVLSMDVLRVLSKSGGEALLCFNSAVQRKLEKPLNSGSELNAAAKKIINGLEEMSKAISANPILLEAGARCFAYSLARSYSAACLLQLAADSSGDQQLINTALRWSAQDLFPFLTNNSRDEFLRDYTKDDYELLFSNYSGGRQ